MIDALAQGLTFLPLQFSRNIISFTIAPASEDLTDRSDLRYLLTIKKPSFIGSNIFEVFRTLEGREKPPYILEGVALYEGAQFPLNKGREGVIDSLLQYTKPARKQKNMRAVLTQTMPYQLVTQVVGGTPTQAINATLPPVYVIKAGLSSEDFSVHGDTFWSDYQANSRRFLTWKPNNQRVAMEQEEYLHFVLNFTPVPSEVRLRVQFRNYGSEPSLATTVMSITNVPLYGIISVPVGPEIVGIDNDYDYYDVWLSNESNTRISEVRTYQLDKKYKPFDRGILFVNSLGGWDTLRCTGRAIQSLNVNQGVAQREKIKTSDVEYSNILVINTEGSRSITISTGFFRRDVAENLNWLDELILSDSCYLMTEKGHIPIQIVTNSLVDADDDSDTVARVINFKIRDIVENYSSIPAGLSTSVRPTTWIGANQTYAVDAFGKRTGTVSYQTLRKAYADNYEIVKPYEFKPNGAGDPNYITPIVDTAVVVGSTPYPNTEIRRMGTFKRNNCGTGGGSAAEIVIPAGKYGGEIIGAAQVLAEAEYNSLNTQEYANTYGSCLFQSTAISRISTYLKQGCGAPAVGKSWIINVPAGTYTSASSQEEADALAISYANSLDTQDNANANGICALGVFANVAIQRKSTYRKQGCSDPQVGSEWTINVPSGTFTSDISQVDADTLANAYANSLDTQANADAYGSCVSGQFYTFIPVAGRANYRFWVSAGTNRRAAAPTTIYSQFPLNYNYDLQLTQPISSHFLQLYNSANYTFSYQIYKNGALLVSSTFSYTTPNIWVDAIPMPSGNAGDLFYIRVY